MKVKPMIQLPDLSDTIIEIPDEKIEQIREQYTTKTTIFGRKKERKEPIADCDELVNEYIGVHVRYHLRELVKNAETTWEEVK